MKTENMILLGLAGYVGYKWYQGKQTAAATAAAAQAVTSATDSPSTDATVPAAATPISTPQQGVMQVPSATSTTAQADASSGTGSGSYIRDQGNRMDSGWNFGGATLTRRGR